MLPMAHCCIHVKREISLFIFRAVQFMPVHWHSWAGFFFFFFFIASNSFFLLFFVLVFCFFLRREAHTPFPPCGPNVILPKITYCEYINICNVARIITHFHFALRSTMPRPCHAFAYTGWRSDLWTGNVKWMCNKFDRIDLWTLEHGLDFFARIRLRFGSWYTPLIHKWQNICNGKCSMISLFWMKIENDINHWITKLTESRYIMWSVCWVTEGNWIEWYRRTIMQSALWASCISTEIVKLIFNCIICHLEVPTIFLFVCGHFTAYKLTMRNQQVIFFFFGLHSAPAPRNHVSPLKRISNASEHRNFILCKKKRRNINSCAHIQVTNEWNLYYHILVSRFVYTRMPKPAY